MQKKEKKGSDEKLEKYYEDLLEEALLKEWKERGKSERDWTKLNVVIFDENNKLKVISNNEFKERAK